MAHAELRDTAIHHGGRVFDVSVGIGQLGELPQELAIGGQPEGELLRHGYRFGGQLFSFRG